MRLMQRRWRAGGGAGACAGDAAAVAGRAAGGGADGWCWRRGTRRRRRIRGALHPRAVRGAGASATPDAVAVVHEDERLSYGELNARANRLAHQLIGLGRRPDERVAICVERSPEMVVGAAGDPEGGRRVCAAGPGLSGGAAGASCWAMRSRGWCWRTRAGRAALGEALSGRAVLDAGRCARTAEDRRGRRSCGAGPDVAAPGLCDLHLRLHRQPKGVMVEHRGVTNLLHGMSAASWDHGAGQAAGHHADRFRHRRPGVIPAA